MIDLAGKVLGKWTVLSRAPNQKSRHIAWLCRCECGRQAVVLSNNLRLGKSTCCRPCGVLKRLHHGELVGDRFGRSSAESTVHESMIQRCLNPYSQCYGRYGGRGITICERWLGPNGLKNFIADMGRRPSNKHSIDRIDNDKGYSPENCRWATRKEQQRNTSRSVFVTAFGQTLPLQEWAERYGIRAECIRSRLTAGWEAEVAVSKPSRSS